MELRHLETFRTVATTLSFSRAAEVLAYAQSTVSTHVSDLEHALGVKLFDRIRREVSLTEAGERVLPLAERILDLAESALQVAKSDAPVGPVVISAPETILAYRLPSVFRAVRRRLPDVSVRIRTGPYARILSDLENGRIDVAFLLQEKIPSNHLAVHVFGPEPLVPVAAADHPIADELAQVDFTVILTERGCGYRHLFQHRLTRSGLSPSQTLEFESVDAIKKCVGAGLGVGYLPEVVVRDEIAAGQLVSVDEFGPPTAVLLQMVHHANRWISPAVSSFMELCTVVLDRELRAEAKSRTLDHLSGSPA